MNVTEEFLFWFGWRWQSVNGSEYDYRSPWVRNLKELYFRPDDVKDLMLQATTKEKLRILHNFLIVFFFFFKTINKRRGKYIENYSVLIFNFFFIIVCEIELSYELCTRYLFSCVQPTSKYSDFQKRLQKSTNWKNKEFGTAEYEKK